MTMVPQNKKGWQPRLPAPAAQPYVTMTKWISSTLVRIGPVNTRFPSLAKNG